MRLSLKFQHPAGVSGSLGSGALLADESRSNAESLECAEAEVASEGFAGKRRGLGGSTADGAPVVSTDHHSPDGKVLPVDRELVCAKEGRCESQMRHEELTALLPLHPL